MTDDRAKRLAALLSELAELMTDRGPAEIPTPRHAPESLLLTVEEAARRLRIGRTHMFALLKSGEIESVRIGRLRRIPVAVINAYADRLRIKQGNELEDQ